MASKTPSSTKLATFLCLNLLFFALTSASGDEVDGGNCESCGPKKPPSVKGKCPINALKLGVCANLLKHLLKVKLGEPPVTPCCSLIKDLADLEAALCLCTAIKSTLLGIKLDIPVSLSLLLNTCGKQAPSGFQCPS